jgi:hypothetical protein
MVLEEAFSLFLYDTAHLTIYLWSLTCDVDGGIYLRNYWNV